MNILILDDDVSRHEGFREIFSDFNHILTHVWTYSQTINAFQKEKFDLACLDHDLGDFSIHKEFSLKEKIQVNTKHFQLSYSPDYIREIDSNSKIFYDGSDVCVWLRDNCPKICPGHCPSKIIIHSWNVPGSDMMEKILKDIKEPNIDILKLPYRSK